MSELVLRVPKELRRGHSRAKELKSVAEGVELIQLICDKLGIADLGNSSMLDVGCGSKFVQAILDRDLPVGRYVGVDVFPDLIEFLSTNVSDPRFSFEVLNTHNEMYNQEGLPLTADTKLAAEEESFDIICLFSVFTHLAPHDYVAMLEMLRRYIKPGGRIIFSLFVNEVTQAGMGFMDRFQKGFAANATKAEKHKEHFEKAVERGGPPDFFDFYADQPLMVAMYSREHAIELVENTGWEIESLNDPQQYIQHYMICKPI